MTMMTPAKRVIIHFSDRDRHQDKTLSQAILDHLQQANACGATLLRGIAGFGRANQAYTTKVVDLAGELPLVLVWVDRTEMVDALLPDLLEMADGNIVTVENVTIYRSQTLSLREMSASQTVHDIMTANAVSVTARTPLTQVVDLLLHKNFRILPVVDENWHVLGILSVGDLMRSDDAFIGMLTGADQPRGKYTATDLMTTPAITIRQSATVQAALALMVEHNIKRVPVIDYQDTLNGIISRADILQFLSETDLQRPSPPPTDPESTLISDIMRTDIPTVLPGVHLPEVVSLLLKLRARRIVVVDSNRHVQGVIADGDVLARVSVADRKAINRLFFGKTKNLKLDSKLTAKMVMATPAITIKADQTLLAGLNLLREHGVKRVPVVDADDKFIGLVERDSLLKALHRQMQAGHSAA